MAETVILSCKCKHAFQDARYGFSKRLHNVMKGERKARCTVCGAVNSIQGK